MASQLKFFLIKYLHTESKQRFANTRENTTKKQLYQVKKEKVEISLELAKKLAKCRIRTCDPLQSRDFLSRGISPQPLKLHNRQKLVTNKAATYAIKLPMRFSTKYK